MFTTIERYPPFSRLRLHEIDPASHHEHHGGMSAQSSPAEFRARATALYRKVRVVLVLLIIVFGGVGFLIGALIGHSIRAHGKYPEIPEGPGWFTAGLIGLAAGAACGTVVAGVIWCAATLFYAMTQDGA